MSNHSIDARGSAPAATFFLLLHQDLIVQIRTAVVDVLRAKKKKGRGRNKQKEKKKRKREK